MMESKHQKKSMHKFSIFKEKKIHVMDVLFGDNILRFLWVEMCKPVAIIYPRNVEVDGSYRI